VAMAGRSFLEALAQREQDNAAYAFLRPTHPLFGYFQGLVDGYRAVLDPPGDVLRALRADSAARGAEALQRAVWRVERARAERRRREGGEGGVYSAHVDWYNFSVLEEVDLEVGEEVSRAWEAPKAFDPLTGTVVGLWGDKAARGTIAASARPAFRTPGAGEGGDQGVVVFVVVSVVSDECGESYEASRGQRE
jgi:Surp module